MNNRETAKKLLVNYFRFVYKKSGLEWDHEMTSEVEDIVDAIVDAAVSEAKEKTKPAVLYHVFYNHDDDLNVESVLGPYLSMESAMEGAQDEHNDYLSSSDGSDAPPLEWEIDNDYKEITYYAPRDKHHERYFRIEQRKVQP